jgi:predicted esterase
MLERFIRVQRTARYHLLGEAAGAKALWIVLHGYGQLARFFLTKFEGLGKDVMIVAPEGLNRYYLDEAHQRVGATWMTREDREHEIQDQVDYLDSLVDLLHGEAGDLPVKVLGFSQGVATACRWSLKGRTRLDHLVLWAGGIPPEPVPEKLRAAWQHMTPDLVLGTQDEFADEKALQAQVARLTSARIPHRVHRFAGGHVLEPVLLARLIGT